MMMSVRRARWCLLVLGLAGGLWHCDDGTGESSPGESATSQAEDDQMSSDASADDEDQEARAESKQGWKERVREKIDRARRRDAGAQARERRSGEGCRLFRNDCGEGKSCFADARGNRRCAPYHPDKSPGDPCRSANDCDRGQQCVGDSPGTCRRQCDPERLDEWGCGLGTACVRMRSSGGRPLDWGVCQPVEDRCERWPDDSCPIGRNCYDTRVGLRCLSYNFEAEIGDPCADGATACNAGQVCVRTETGVECRARCDDEHPCDRGTCRDLSNFPHGYCGLGEAASESSAEGVDRVQGW